MAEDRSMIVHGECPWCEAGYPVVNGLHDLPEPGGMHRCRKGALSGPGHCPISIDTFIYLATPYSHPHEPIREWRYVQAKRICHSLIINRLPTFSPIVHCHPIARANNLPGDAEFWWDYNLRFLTTCSLIAVAHIEGWDRSIGVQKEIDWARNNQKPVLAVNVSEDGPQFRELG